MKKLFVLLTALVFGSGVGCTRGCSDNKGSDAPANSGDSTVSSDGQQKEASNSDSNLPTAITELVIKDTAPGEGAEAKAGETVEVHYTGWLYDPSQPEGKGAKFDSSVDRGQTFKFPLGAGRVISGWDQGVAGMKVKGKRTLIIPPSLAYGEQGAGNVIPPNSTLIFDVELIGVAN